MRRLRWTVALAVQAGAHRVLLPTHSGDHDLSPSQRVMFMAISVGLVIAAGLMSGLTLGLMSMDLVELEVLKRSGTATEQKYSAAIYPIVSNQHFLLVTLLLCNACAMEALPLFLDRLADPVTAILISVSAVLVFGEVLPQAVCSRYGLAIGYYCAWLVRALMLLTSPISWPIGKLLDFLLGAEHRALFRRGQLKALVDIHGADEGLGGNLTEDEIKVICGALDLTSKTARKSMTPLNKVFMLPADARLNQQTMRAILASGHSRIPVYTRGDRSSIIGLILVKELLQYKTHQEVPVSDVRMRSLPRLPADTPMYDMLKLFQTGRSHMVVLTDTPATARAAAEAAALAAVAAAAAAAAAEAASDSSSSSGGSPLSKLRGKGRKSKRLQFESPLLQPIDSVDEDAANAAQQQGCDGVQPGGDTAPEGGPCANGHHHHQQQQQQHQEQQQQLRIDCLEAHHQQQQEQQLDFSAGAHLALLRTSSGSRSRGRVGFHEQADPQAERRPLLQQDAGVALSDSSSSLSRLQLTIPPQQQQSEQEGTAPIAIARSSSGGGSGSSKGGLRARSKSGPMLMSLLASGAEGDLLSDIMNGPEGVAVPLGIITIEDVIEELMQAEIVDETDLYVDNERSITVNSAALAQSLPDQLRIALQSPQHHAAVAGVAGALAGVAAAAAAAGGRVGPVVNVRKLFKQRSSSTLGQNTSTGGGLSTGPAGGSGSWSGSHAGDTPGPSPLGVAPASALTAGLSAVGPGGAAGQGQLHEAGPSRGAGSGSTASSTGVVAAVSAGLAAAAAAVGGKSAADGAERLPLLSSAEQTAAAHNR